MFRLSPVHQLQCILLCIDSTRDNVVVSRVIDECMCACVSMRESADGCLRRTVSECESRPQSLRARRRVAVAMKFRLDECGTRRGSKTDSMRRASDHRPGIPPDASHIAEKPSASGIHAAPAPLLSAHLKDIRFCDFGGIFPMMHLKRRSSRQEIVLFGYGYGSRLTSMLTMRLGALERTI